MSVIVIPGSWHLKKLLNKVFIVFQHFIISSIYLFGWRRIYYTI